MESYVKDFRDIYKETFAHFVNGIFRQFSTFKRF